jgi:hypothetical protein
MEHSTSGVLGLTAHILNMEKGIFEFQVNGKDVGLRFGTRALRLLENKLKEDISIILGRAATGKTGIDFMCTIFECAALDYAITHKKEIDIKNDDMPDWIDAVGGINEALKILTEGITQYFPKNSASPVMETGEVIIP